MEDHTPRFHGRPHSHMRAPRVSMLFLLISALLINGTRPDHDSRFRAGGCGEYQG